MHDLSDALGDDHDPAVMSSQIRADPQRFGAEQTVAATLRLIVGWQPELQRRALSLGRRLYVESPRRYSKRVAGYLDVWREHGDEADVGEIDDLW